MDFKAASVRSQNQLLEELHTGLEGLANEEAERRFFIQKNQGIKFKEVLWPTILLRQLRSAFVYLLLVAALISSFLGEYLDAFFIFVFLIVNTCIGFFQEYKAEHSLRLLQKFSRWKTRVKRSGKEKWINAEEVVEGDIICLRAGDMIPADGYFLRTEDVTVDESPLTGESAPVEKISRQLEHEPKNFYEAVNIGFFRTTIQSGDAEMIVFACGKNTEVGEIATKTEKTESPSAFEIGISGFSSFILKLALITIGLMILANIFIHNGEVNISSLLIFAIALTVGIIPEALPLVTTLSMSQGALRLAKKNVVPRRLSAIEDLGSIEVLCTDKTGTITENKMKVAEILGNREEVIFWALAGSTAFIKSGDIQKENIFDNAIAEILTDEIKLRLKHIKYINDLSFDPIRKRESVLLKEGTDNILVTRGAPEKFIYGKYFSKEEAEKWVKIEGEKGRRVLAMGKSIFIDGDNESDLLQYEKNSDVVGLISFTDPLKATARQALQDAEELGVRVKIITGDTKEVAGWIGCEAGLIDKPMQVLTGEELMAMSELEQEEAVEKFDVFARTTPLEKEHIIGLLKKKFLVGFLGEGFNDAPALKLAHVALAVDGASDIAREASDIILLNKSLEVIVEGIREGRKIFANTIKYIKATLTSNFGNFYALAFASLLVNYLPMLPMQILLLNLMTDLPMVSIAADRVDEQDLKRPHGYNVKEIVLIALILGLVSTGFDFAFFGFFVGEGQSTLQTMWFIGSVLTELILLFSIRTSSFFFAARALPSYLIVMLSLLVSFLAIWLPFSSFGQNFFSFRAPEIKNLLIVVILVFLYFISTEIVKVVYYRMFSSKSVVNR